MESYEEIARHFEQSKKEGKELDNLVPVKASVDPKFGIVYSVRFSQDDMARNRPESQGKGVKLSAFIRTATLAATKDELDLKDGERGAALQEARKKARDLTKSMDRLQ